MPRDPLELALPEDLDSATAAALVAERLGTEPGRARTDDRILLDTFDRRLRAAGLRADRGARGAAATTLTLHEPGAPERRAEVAVAAGHLLSALPAGPLRERLATVLGERALLPVARLRTRTVALDVRNEDAKTVARVAIEHAEAVLPRRPPVPLTPRVSVRPMRGYEADFDRVAGVLRDGLGLAPAPGSLYDQALRAAGEAVEGVSTKPDIELEPGTRADVAAGLVLTRLAGIVEANLPGAVADLDTEFLHDLRVSIRRARSVLRELAGVHAAGPRARLRAELKWAQGVTGPLRDLDVQLLGWEELVGDQAAALEPLHELLARQRAAALAPVLRSLRGRRFASLLEAWHALATAPPAADADVADRPRAALAIDAVAADRIRSVYRRMVRDGRAIDDDSPDADLHELRKRGKELRYLLELFGGVFAADVVKPMVKTLKGLQEVLGEFQDLTVQRAQLRAAADELTAQGANTEALLAMGRLMATLEARQHEVRAAFAERFAAFSSSGRRKLVRRTFAKLEDA